jgi:hypothetical protein
MSSLLPILAVLIVVGGIFAIVDFLKRSKLKKHLENQSLLSLQSAENSPQPSFNNTTPELGMDFQMWFEKLLSRTFEDSSPTMTHYVFLTNKWIWLLGLTKEFMIRTARKTESKIQDKLEPGETNVIRWKRQDPTSFNPLYVHCLQSTFLWLQKISAEQRAAAEARWPGKAELCWDPTEMFDQIVGGLGSAGSDYIVFESSCSPNVIDDEIRRLSKTIEGLV